MDTNTAKIKYINVLGTTYSGSGAVFDYLSGRGDLYNPLFGVEYELPQMPYGLMALEAASEKCFDPSSVEFYILNFENNFRLFFKNLEFYILKNNKSPKTMTHLFKEEIKNFINEVSVTNFPIKLNWRNYYEPWYKKLLFKIENTFCKKNSIPRTRILTSQEKLIFSAKKMHDRIFQINSNDRPILLNQAGSGWNPIESTKYFSSCKIILVTRDPRDQFSELKRFKHANSVCGFVNWYKEMQRRLAKIDQKNIYFLNFENFVCNNTTAVEEICDFLNLSPIKKSSYNPELSIKNINNYNAYLNKDEINIIEQNLKDFIKK